MSKLIMLSIKVPEDTKRAWQRAARSSGLSLSEWMRIRCNGIQIEAQPPALPARKAG